MKEPYKNSMNTCRDHDRFIAYLSTLEHRGSQRVFEAGKTSMSLSEVACTAGGKQVKEYQDQVKRSCSQQVPFMI